MRDDDDLVSRLADLAREEEAAARRRLDPRWDRLAAGALAPEEAAALAAEAGRTPEAAEALAAFTPLGEEFRAGVVVAVRGELGGEEPAPAAPEVRGPARLEEARRRRRPRAEDAEAQVWRRGRRRVLAGAAAAAAGLAAAVVLAVLRPWAAVAPLPPYAASLSGATEQWRGEPPETSTAPPRFAPGNRLELVLTPERAVEGRPEVAIYLARDGALAPWRVPFEVSGHGAVRIAGAVGEDLRLPAGESQLAVAVARRREAIPGEAAIARALREWSGASPGCLPLADDAWLCVADLDFRRDS